MARRPIGRSIARLQTVERGDSHGSQSNTRLDAIVKLN